MMNLNKQKKKMFKLLNELNEKFRIHFKIKILVLECIDNRKYVNQIN